MAQSKARASKGLYLFTPPEFEDSGKFTVKLSALSHKQLIYIEQILQDSKSATAAFRVCEESIIKIEDASGEAIHLNDLPFNTLVSISDYVLYISSVLEEDYDSLQISTKMHFDAQFNTDTWKCSECQRKGLDKLRNCGYLNYKDNPKVFSDTFQVTVGHDQYTHCPIYDINKEILSDAIECYNSSEAKFLPDSGGLYDQTRFFVISSRIVGEKIYERDKKQLEEEQRKNKKKLG